MIFKGDVYYADLNPVIGSEQGGVRPVVVLQNVPSPKKQTKNVREKPNEKNDKYNMKLLYPTVFSPRFA